MYEHLRNEYLAAAHDAQLPAEALQIAVIILDTVAEHYDIMPRELALAPYTGDGLPEIVKIYLVCNPNGMIQGSKGIIFGHSDMGKIAVATQRLFAS